MMVGLSQRKIQENKQEIISLLRSVERDGMDKLIAWLEKHDYFTAPASTAYHLSCVGGLAQHSLNVYYELMTLYYGKDWRTLKNYPICKDDVDHETIIIVALLHDLCKVDFYKLGTRNVKENGAWKEIQVYSVDEKIPIMGHGSKSVIVAQQFIRLYSIEIQAISFHMGMQDSDAQFSSQVSGVFATLQLALYTHLADLKATFEDDQNVDEGSGDSSAMTVDDDDLPL